MKTSHVLQAFAVSVVQLTTDASVTGPWSTLVHVILPPVSCFCPWSARGRHMMGSERIGRSIYAARSSCAASSVAT